MTAVAREIFSFPHPANEYAARLVAGMVASLSLVIVLLDLPWLLFVLLYGFAARVLTGPTLSPMGLLATRVLVPLAGSPDKPVAGPPNALRRQWASASPQPLCCSTTPRAR